MSETVLTAEEIKIEERKAKRRARNRAYQSANREKILARRLRWREVNKEGLNAKDKAYREANREKSKDYQRKYYAANRAKAKAYRIKNKEKIQASALKRWIAKAPERKLKLEAREKKVLEANRIKELKRLKWEEGRPARKKLAKEKATALRTKWRKENREKYLEEKRIYRENNKEKLAEARRIYKQANPDIKSAGKARRRVKLRSNPLNTSTHRLRKFLKDQKVPCCYCNAEWDESFHVDHYIPVNSGGPEATWNLRSSCQSCNLSKGARMPWNFMQSPNLNYYDEQNCTGKTETSKEEKTQTGEETVRTGYSSVTLASREGIEDCNCNCSTNESKPAGD